MTTPQVTSARPRRLLRTAGWALVLVGVALVVPGVLFVWLTWGLSDTAPPKPRGWGGLTVALLELGLFALPGLLVTGAGWVLLRSCGTPAVRAPVVMAACIVLLGWVGAAYAISDPFPPSRNAPAPVVRTPRQQAADNAAFAARAAEDARHHPIPASVLRAQERDIRQALRRAGVTPPVRAKCRRDWEWHVTCQFSPTAPDGAFILGAHYLPHSGVLLRDEPLPTR